MPKTIDENIERAKERIEFFKKERKGFNNLFNGYRAYCNLKIEYWKGFLNFCTERLESSK